MEYRGFGSWKERVLGNLGFGGEEGFGSKFVGWF
jgi:hypothetical protein